MELFKIIEAAVAVSSAIGLVATGIYIGNHYGTFESFIKILLEKLKSHLE